MDHKSRKRHGTGRGIHPDLLKEAPRETAQVGIAFKFTRTETRRTGTRRSDYPEFKMQGFAIPAPLRFELLRHAAPDATAGYMVFSTPAAPLDLTLPICGFTLACIMHCSATH